MEKMNHWVIPGIYNLKTLDEIYKSILDDLNILSCDLGYKSRKREFVDKRTVMFYLMHRIVGFTSTAVAKKFNLNHATVLHHCNKLACFLEVKNPDFKYVLDLENKYRHFKIN